MKIRNEKLVVSLLRACVCILILFVVPANAEKSKEEKSSQTQFSAIEERLTDIEEKINSLRETNHLTPEEREHPRDLKSIQGDLQKLENQYSNLINYFFALIGIIITLLVAAYPILGKLINKLFEKQKVRMNEYSEGLAEERDQRIIYLYQVCQINNCSGLPDQECESYTRSLYNLDDNPNILNLMNKSLDYSETGLSIINSNEFSELSGRFQDSFKENHLGSKKMNQISYANILNNHTQDLANTIRYYSWKEHPKPGTVVISQNIIDALKTRKTILDNADRLINYAKESLFADNWFYFIETAANAKYIAGSNQNEVMEGVKLRKNLEELKLSQHTDDKFKSPKIGWDQWIKEGRPMWEKIEQPLLNS